VRVVAHSGGAAFHGRLLLGRLLLAHRTSPFVLWSGHEKTPRAGGVGRAGLRVRRG
jgi:hypothetical protein